MRLLIEAVNAAQAWAKEQSFPCNPTVQRLRESEYIEHKGASLKNAHRSDNALCDTLAGLIATQKLKSILEIGTLFGYSTLHLAEAASLVGGRVTTIDMRQKSRKWITGEVVEDIHDLAVALARESRLDDHITFMSGRSDVEMPKMTLAGDRFDLIFIDGSHSSHIVLLDLINAFNMLNRDGLIILDDTSENVALRDYNHGGPNIVLMHLLGNPHLNMLPLSYNTLLIQKSD